MSDPRALAQQEIRDIRKRITKLSDDGIDLVLRKARSHYGWHDRPVTDDDLKQIFDIMVEGPTSNNGHPMRIIFARTDETKQRLVPALKGNNVEKVLTSPVCAILAYDMKFYKRMPELFPHDPGKGQMFIDDPKRCADDAFRNGTLQAAYFIIAARALGFDTLVPFPGLSMRRWTKSSLRELVLNRIFCVTLVMVTRNQFGKNYPGHHSIVFAHFSDS